MFNLVLRAVSQSVYLALLTATAKAVSNGIGEIAWKFSCRVETSTLTETDLLTWVALREWGKLDEALFGPNIAVGNLVIHPNENGEANFGFVCGNGSEWFAFPLDNGLKSIVKREFLRAKIEAEEGENADCECPCCHTRFIGEGREEWDEDMEGIEREYAVCPVCGDVVPYETAEVVEPSYNSVDEVFEAEEEEGPEEDRFLDSYWEGRMCGEY